MLLLEGRGEEEQLDIDLVTTLGLAFAALLRTSRRFLGVEEGRMGSIYTGYLALFLGRKANGGGGGGLVGFVGGRWLGT